MLIMLFRKCTGLLINLQEKRSYTDCSPSENEPIHDAVTNGVMHYYVKKLLVKIVAHGMSRFGPFHADFPS